MIGWFCYFLVIRKTYALYYAEYEDRFSGYRVLLTISTASVLFDIGKYHVL